jgi:O-antigen ligase/Tfp pilus assembly protein PilF
VAVILGPAPADGALDRVFPPGWNRDAAGEGLSPDERRALERWLANGPEQAWRPLSISPARTRLALTKTLAIVAIFLVVTAYTPAGDRRRRRRLERRALQWLVFVAFVVAAIGLLQRAAWNGKLLWVFVPWDWGMPHVGAPQTSGPFVNRNHFANYLALLWPLALTPVLFAGALTRSTAARLAFGVASATIAVALLWSLSRGGWLAALTGGVVLLLSGANRGTSRRTLLRPLAFVAASAAAAIALALAPIGEPGGNELDLRLEQTVTDTSSLTGRIVLWRDTLPLMRDHPWLGVGLGAWRDAFPRYDSSLRHHKRAHRAHNDYVQWVAETGLLGTVLLGGALFGIARLLAGALAVPTRRSRPILAASVAGSAAVAVHACVDFGLQIPAIPVTLAVLLGLALRDSWPRRRAGTTLRGPLFGVGLGGGLLLALTASPDPPPEDDPSLSASLLAASSQPASIAPQLALATLALESSLEAGRGILASAIALDPQSAGPRDALAVTLARLGRDADALAAIEESVARAPHRQGHVFLQSGIASWLSTAESAAVERGLRRALPHAGTTPAVTLAVFLRDRRRFEAAGQAWVTASERALDAADRASYLRNAGHDFIRAGAPDEAREAFEQALHLDPGHTETYLVLLTHVLGPARQLEGTEALLTQARRHGADFHRLVLALAQAARRAGDSAHERRALERAVATRPDDPAAHVLLGRLNAREGADSAAAEAFRRALETDPHDASAWHGLGRAEERQYHFAEALEAFEAAVREAPENASYAKSLGRFRKKLEANESNAPES